MVTGIWDSGEAKRALDAGAYEYIRKPIDPRNSPPPRSRRLRAV
jgi:CheY-like chemotaxis protein